MPDLNLARALELFGLAELPDRERLERKRRELLATWHPHRYANLTNNPRKYMQMYKKGEAMTREIEAAYQLLLARLEDRAGND
ncbi:hypothetical protein [Nitrospira sp. Kam-Ns4a]